METRKVDFCLIDRASRRIIPGGVGRKIFEADVPKEISSPYLRKLLQGGEITVAVDAGAGVPRSQKTSKKKTSKKTSGSDSGAGSGGAPNG